MDSCLFLHFFSSGCTTFCTFLRFKLFYFTYRHRKKRALPLPGAHSPVGSVLVVDFHWAIFAAVRDFLGRHNSECLPKLCGIANKLFTATDTHNSQRVQSIARMCTLFDTSTVFRFQLANGCRTTKTTYVHSHAPRYCIVGGRLSPLSHFGPMLSWLESCVRQQRSSIPWSANRSCMVDRLERGTSSVYKMLGLVVVCPNNFSQRHM